MGIHKKNPLRKITEEEKTWLERISRSQSEPAGHVSRAKEILVMDPKNWTQKKDLKGRGLDEISRRR